MHTGLKVRKGKRLKDERGTVRLLWGQGLCYLREGAYRCGSTKKSVQMDRLESSKRGTCSHSAFAWIPSARYLGFLTPGLARDQTRFRVIGLDPYDRAVNLRLRDNTIKCGDYSQPDDIKTAVGPSLLQS